jgi:hypothetical protein
MSRCVKDVDGRVKPGHDERMAGASVLHESC